MNLDYSKLFTGARQKAATIVSVEELGKIFTGNDSWGRNGEMEQYKKSLYVFAAINKIATKVSAIDLQLFKIINKNGDSTEVMNHPVLDLLTKCNPFQTRNEFLKITWINKKLTGEAFWLKVRNSNGSLAELWNLRPDFMTVVTDPNKYILEYRLQKSNGGMEVFAPEDVIHFKDPDPLNQFRGMSPIAVAKTRIETEASASLFQRDFFRNNARPDALLITPETLDTEQRTQMTSSWDEEHQGRHSNSKIGILEGGMTYQQVSISQREMDYIESSKFTRDDILVALGVPKAVITADDINYANAETGLHVFLSETITPEMDHLVEVCNEMLVIPDFGEEFYLDFKDPTPSDRDSLRADHTAGFGKWLTVNEIRADYHLEPIEGGDVIATPSLFGADPLTPGTPVTPAPADPAATPDAADESGNAAPAKSRVRFMARKRNMALKTLQGRPMLRRRFEIAEEMIKGIASQKVAIADVVTAKQNAKKTKTVTKTEKTEDKKEYMTIFKEQKMRDAYYDMVNKRIDNRSIPFRRALIAEFAKQQERVIAELKKLDSDAEGKSLEGRRMTKKIKAQLQEKLVNFEKLLHADVNSILEKSMEVKLFADLSFPFLKEFAKQGGQDAASMTGETFNLSPALTTALSKKAYVFAEVITQTTFKNLVDTLSAGINAGEGIGDLTSRVKDVYGAVPDYRANMIARTETTYANNTGMLDMFQQSDVVQGKEWISTLDERTRETHAAQNGEIVGVNDFFSDGLRYPGDENGDVEEIINCRCVLGPALYK